MTDTFSNHEDVIIYHIQIVIDGYCNTINLSNTYSEWKNITNKLEFIDFDNKPRQREIIAQIVGD